MMVVKHLMPAGATIADARLVMELPEVAAKLAAIGTTQKSATKARMRAQWGPAIAEIFLPNATRPGRPKLDAEGKSVWHPLAQALLAGIAERLEVDLPLSEEVAFWTKEAASLASDEIHARYPNYHSAVVNATKFRNILRGFGVNLGVIDATKRAEVTTVHNAKIAVEREDREEKGIYIPPEFSNIATLVARAEAFIKAPVTDPVTSLNAADFMVIMTARPKEALESFRPGPTGGVLGVLKKREEDEAEYPIVSAVGPALAFEYLVAWRARNPGAIKKAMNSLNERVKNWGLKRPDLRAIGAELAVRAGKESGELKNDGMVRSFREMALKHGEAKPATQKLGEFLRVEPQAEPEIKPEEGVKVKEEVKAKEEPAPKKKPQRKAAQDHYTRVNDPTLRICAKLSNASADNQTAVDAFLSMSEEQQKTIRAIIAAIK